MNFNSNSDFIICYFERINLLIYFINLHFLTLITTIFNVISHNFTINFTTLIMYNFLKFINQPIIIYFEEIINTGPNFKY